MNKKGFTLVEILAVIIILGIIMVVVGTNGFGAFDKTKEKINQQNIAAIKEAANVLMIEVVNCDENLDKKLIEKYAGTNKKCSDLKNEATKNGEEGCLDIKLDYLISEKYITGSGVEDILNAYPDYTVKGCIEANNKILIEVPKITPEDNGGDTLEGETPEEETVEVCLDSAYNVSSDTLTCKIMTNTNITKNSTTPTFNDVATEEEGMYSAEDDYGTSWYFRGAQSNNYVNFAGFTWRIVRINGDGSVRLILEGTLEKVPACDDATICKNTVFNSDANDNAYVGYMYGFTGMTGNVCIKTDEGGTRSVGTETDSNTCQSKGGEWTSPYDATHMNLNDSTIKTQLDKFYQKYLNTYNNYISDTLFCGDKSLAQDGIGGVSTQLGYESKNTYYAATARLYYSIGTTSVTYATPTLKCAETIDDTYSRYTVNGETTNKGIETNGDLTYPIALLSADELVMAGAFNIKENKFYYLYDAYAKGLSTYWWTISPSGFHDSYALEFISFEERSLESTILDDILSGVRPVINVKSDILWASGDGTSSNPYTVKLS